jgi:hypothetical protein
MAKRKGPFRGYSEKEVLEAEASSFVIQCGNDYWSNNSGDFVFTQSQAERHYNSLLSNIILTLKEGNEMQKRSARKCLEKLWILPLRIQ